MATVKQLKTEEARYEALWNEAMTQEAAAGTPEEKRAIYAAAKPLSTQRWRFHKLAQARCYRFRAGYDHYEEAGESSRTDAVVNHSYEPNFATEDQAWTALDGDNVEFLRAHHLPQSYNELEPGDRDTTLGLYLEARDLVLEPEQMPAEAAQRIKPEVHAFLASQWRAGLFTVYRCELYDCFALMHDDGEWLRLSEMAYDSELGLHRQALAMK